jgi:hypothetical protein
VRVGGPGHVDQVGVAAHRVEVGPVGAGEPGLREPPLLQVECLGEPQHAVQLVELRAVPPQAFVRRVGRQQRRPTRPRAVERGQHPVGLGPHEERADLRGRRRRQAVHQHLLEQRLRLLDRFRGERADLRQAARPDLQRAALQVGVQLLRQRHQRGHGPRHLDLGERAELVDQRAGLRDQLADLLRSPVPQPGTAGADVRERLAHPRLAAARQVVGLVGQFGQSPAQLGPGTGFDAAHRLERGVLLEVRVPGLGLGGAAFGVDELGEHLRRGRGAELDESLSRLGLVREQRRVGEKSVPLQDFRGRQRRFVVGRHVRVVAEPAEPRLLLLEPRRDRGKGSSVAGVFVLTHLVAARGDQLVVQLRPAQAEAFDGREAAADRVGRRVLVVVGGGGRDAFDRDLQVRHVLTGRADHTDRERLDLGRQLVADLAERAVGVCGDEHPLALREQVRQQRGRRVGLAGARRALHQRLRLRVDLPDDAELGVVDGQRKERVAVDLDQRAVLRVPRVRPGAVVGVDQRAQPVRHVLFLGQLVHDGREDLDEPLLRAPAQDDRGRVRGDRVLLRRQRCVVVAVLAVRVERVHESADERAGCLAVQGMCVEVTRVGADLVDVPGVRHETGVEHVELDVRGADRLDAVDGQPAGVVVEPDADRRGQQVPPHAGRRPGQAADADDQLKLLRVAVRGDVGGEELGVAGTDGPVEPLALGPGTPRDEPGDVLLGELGRGVVGQVRRGAGVMPAGEPRLQLVGRRRVVPGDPLDGEDVRLRLGITPVRGADRRVVGQAVEPQRGPVPVDRPWWLVSQLLCPPEELEQTNGAADQRVGGRGCVVHPALPVAVRNTHGTGPSGPRSCLTQA